MMCCTNEILSEELKSKIEKNDQPLMHNHVLLARAIYEVLDHINQISGEVGQIEQSRKEQKQEWCRVCALVIEDEMKAWVE